MARRKRIAYEDPYHPIRGMNADTRAFGLHPQECKLLQNLRVSPDQLETREGTSEFSQDIPGGLDVLHLHKYKAPAGATTLYAFTATDVWKYRASDNSWRLPHTVSDIHDLDSLTNVAGAGTETLVTSGQEEGTGYVACSGVNIGGGANILGLIDLGALDLTGATHIGFYVRSNGTDATFSLSFYTGTSFGGSLLETFTTETDGTTLGVKEVTDDNNWYLKICKITTPAGWGTVNSAVVRGVTGDASGALDFDHFFYYKTLVAQNQTSAADLEFWHTTDYIDDSLGTIVVAAGSNPPSHDEAEDDASNRVLLYGNSSGTWAALSQTETINVTAEDTGADVPDAAGAAVTGTLANGGTWTSVVPGATLYFYTDIDGILGWTETTVTADVDTDEASSQAGYLVIANDSTKITEGVNNSYIESGTGQWKLTFAASHGYVAENILCTYSYKIAAAKNPRFVWGFHNRLLGVNLYDGNDSVYYPWRVVWSDLGDATEVDYTAFADLIDNDVTAVLGGDYQNTTLNIYKKDSIVRGIATGDTNVFSFATIWKSGTFFGRSPATMDGMQFYLGKDDVYFFDGAQSRSITEDPSTGASRIRDYIFSLVNQAGVHKIFGMVHKPRREYWLWITEGDDTYPTKAFVYNISLQAWYLFDFNQEVTCSATFAQSVETTWNTITGTWDNAGGTWADYGSSELFDSILFGVKDLGVFKLDKFRSEDWVQTYDYRDWTANTDISIVYETRDFIFGDLTRKDRLNRVDMEMTGDTGITLTNSTDLGLTYTQSQAAYNSPTQYAYQYFPDSVGKHHRIKATGTGIFQILWVQPYAIIRDLIDNQ